MTNAKNENPTAPTMRETTPVRQYVIRPIRPIRPTPKDYFTQVGSTACFIFMVIIFIVNDPRMHSDLVACGICNNASTSNLTHNNIFILDPCDILRLGVNLTALSESALSRNSPCLRTLDLIFPPIMTSLLLEIIKIGRNFIHTLFTLGFLLDDSINAMCMHVYSRLPHNLRTTLEGVSYISSLLVPVPPTPNEIDKDIEYIFEIHDNLFNKIKMYFL